MNGYITMILVIYLAVVLAKDKEKELVKMLSEEGDFAKWAISLGTVGLLASKMGASGGMVLTLVYTSMALVAVRKNPKIFDNISKILTIQ